MASVSPKQGTIPADISVMISKPVTLASFKPKLASGELLAFSMMSQPIGASRAKDLSEKSPGIEFRRESHSEHRDECREAALLAIVSYTKQGGVVRVGHFLLC
jgi:hypothetical protein